MQFHEVANIFPMMTADEFEALCKDIAENGQLEPIWLYDGQIIDGRNRYRACKQVGIEPKFRTWAGDGSLVAFVASLNLHRRHLNSGQRAVIALEVLPMLEAEALEKKRQAGAKHGVSQREKVQQLIAEAISKPQARDEAAQIFQTNHEYVTKAKKLATESPDLLEQVRSGELGILEAAKRMRQAEAAAKREQNERLKAETPKAVQVGKYETIVIDPPWEMEKIQRDVAPNQVAFDYPTMNGQELAVFDVGGMAEENCHLFCWTTHKHLPLALRLMPEWGFRYVLLMTWHKAGGFQPFGLPQYNSEFCIYARKGSPKFIDTKQFFTCFNAPRREHSRKPDEFYDVIRRVTEGPRIDVFSREKRDGFDQYGNETDKF